MALILVYPPPLLLSQMQTVASKLAEARYIPFGDQSTEIVKNRSNLINVHVYKTSSFCGKKDDHDDDVKDGEDDDDSDNNKSLVWGELYGYCLELHNVFL